jgi:anti-sigma-K factor RskA
MNTPRNDNHEHLRYAEYVLGVLDADARATVERETREDPQAATAVTWWQQHLAPLSEEMADVPPPDYVWARIQSELGIAPRPSAPARPQPADHVRPRRGLWSDLSFWRRWGLAASAVAIACLILLFAFPPRPTPPAPQPTAAPTYMVSNIQQTSGGAAWTATVDVAHQRMIITPSGKVSVPTDRTAELWLIPKGKNPVAVGLLPQAGAAVLSLPAHLLAQISPTTALAVSIEPRGGSPTGQPTGPVVAKGAINATTQPPAP